MDYFQEDLDGEYDVITSFRYLRHFEYYQRKAIYQKIKKNLATRGLFIFDVPNIRFEMPVRNQNGWDKYNIYDVFMTKEDMVSEMEENGFCVAYMIAIGAGMQEGISDVCKNEPVTWTFGVTKKL